MDLDPPGPLSLNIDHDGSSVQLEGMYHDMESDIYY